MSMPALIDKDFKKFFDEDLQSLIKSLESERTVAKKWAYFPLLFIIGIILLVFYTRTESNFLLVLGILCILAGLIFISIQRGREKKYISDFKETVIKKIIQFVDPSFQYKPSSFINKNIYYQSGLYLNDCDRYKGDDFVEGKYGNTAFCFSELHTEVQVNSGKSSYWQTIFKGIFFMADYNKEILSRTYVWNKNHPQMNFIIKRFSSFGTNLEKVTLESGEFERRFIVYSTDQVESRYILTPSMMEQMMKLEDKLQMEIAFSFLDNKIYVALPMNKNLFDVEFLHTLSFDESKRYYDVVVMVLNVIDELEINAHIGN